VEDRSPEVDEESYAYSLFVPAEGSFDPAPPVQAAFSQEADQEAPTSHPGAEQTSLIRRVTTVWNQEVRTVKSKRSVASLFQKLKFSRLQTIALIAWTAIAGAGAITAYLEASPSMTMQMGALGGVWLAVSAAVWLLPSRLVH
jgi:hypothetical protein